MTSTHGGASAAVIGAVASEPRAGFSSDAAAAVDFWSLLVNARTSEQLCRAWLGILCQWVPGTQAGLLLLHDEGEQYAPAAVWPDAGRDMAFLADVAQQALVERRGVVRDEASGLAQCAYPLLAADTAYGVVVLHVASRGGAAMRDTLRILHWGAGWLVDLFDRRNLVEREQRLQRSALLQDLLLGVMAEPGPEQAARWVVNRLVQGLPCRQALIGQAGEQPRNPEVALLAVSGSAGFDARSNLLSAAREAMHEALLAGHVQRHPPIDLDAAAPALAASALADFCQEARSAAALVLPMSQPGGAAAVLLLDFETVPDAACTEFCHTLALALAPALALQRNAARGWWRHGRDSLGAATRALAGPRHPGLKLAGVLALLLLTLAALWPLPYRVGAPATVEGRVQRAAVAPFAGFIVEAKHRAGDKVSAGDMLARLDDRELKLEQAKWQAQAEVAERKLREAMARGNAVAVQLNQAEADEAYAELALVASKLARVVLTAPFDGVVVRGDLSQQLGAPVELGKVLFEVAPLDEWRVVLRVDERDILQVKQAAAGELVLSGLPGEKHRIVVTRVAPMAVAEDGRNAFRVEAEVQGQRQGIQPGMEGVGKIDAGEHSLLWIALHRVVDWARYAAWTIGL